MGINNFTVIESEYGRFIVNRHCTFQAEALLKTGRPHIEIELQNIFKVASTLPPNCVIVDAGANIGLISIPLAQAVREKGGVVHAFEVQKMLFYALCGSAALNDLENLQIHRSGLGAARSVRKVPRPNYGVAQDFGILSLVEQAEISSGEQVELSSGEQVEICALDDLSLPRLDFIKIDVEGMEIDVLQGARHTIATHLPWAWIENWKVETDLIKQQFDSLSYKFFQVSKLDVLCAPAARLAASKLVIPTPEI
jgi:FkbM family methyltransferase